MKPFWTGICDCFGVMFNIVELIFFPSHFHDFPVVSHCSQVLEYKGEKERECVCVCVSAVERERVCVCVWVLMRGRKSVYYLYFGEKERLVKNTSWQTAIIFAGVFLPVQCDQIFEPKVAQFVQKCWKLAKYVNSLGKSIELNNFAQKQVLATVKITN